MSISRHQAVGAYRRWEPDSFDDDDGGGSQKARRPNAALAKQPPAPPASAFTSGLEHESEQGLEYAPEREPASAHDSTAPSAEAFDGELPADFKLPTAEELERMHEDIRAAAMEEGRHEGHAEGYAAGHDEGYAEGKARAEGEAARLAGLAEQLERSLTGIDHEVAEELMALAIELARQMVRETLAQHPESILETIRMALQQLPQGHAHIYLHPEDLALVRKHMGEQLSHGGHRLQEDASLMRGDCRANTGGAQVDATLETRWRRVLESLGHEHARFVVVDEPAVVDEPTIVDKPTGIDMPDAAAQAIDSVSGTQPDKDEGTSAAAADSVEHEATPNEGELAADPGEDRA